jgi:hypothetical protein
LKNVWTGKVIVMDAFEIRLGKLKTRIFDWAERVDQFRKIHDARLVMLTLTYRRVGDWKPGHIGTYLKNIKTKLGKNLLAFAWVAELQARGAVHYHVMLLVEIGTQIPMPDKKGYWTHGRSNVETAKTAFYLASYAGKKYQKDLSKYPKGCHLYATSLRPSMGIPAFLRRSGGQIGPKIRTAEGGPVWEYKGSAVTRGYCSVLSEESPGV